mmetsp:Transcript_44421/g.100332  ORF Transcript_44421/g.100332 Transcript_44421/m.100332 type:complete len:171 (+) Transcript_44421:117-629(+)
MDSLGGPIAPRSSLPLQIAIWLDGWVTQLLVVVVLALLIGKPYFLPYPPGAAQGEFLLMLCHLPVQSIRNWFGTAGNRQERASFIAVFLSGTVWTTLVTGYFWKLQTYCLRLESYLAVAALALAAMETVGAVLAGIAFSIISDNLADLLRVVVAFGAALVGDILLVYLVS